MTNRTQSSQDAAAPEAETLATGNLVYGVSHGGRRHYKFALRLPTMGDNIDALEAYPAASGARIDVVMFAACMERLGDVPAEEITYELLASMVPSDMDTVYEAVEAAKKKLLLPNDDSDSTEKSSSSSASTASSKSVSVA